MAFHSVWIFPILATGFALAAFICGYSIAAGKKDADAWFMYIRLIILHIDLYN